MRKPGTGRQHGTPSRVPGKGVRPDDGSHRAGRETSSFLLTVLSVIIAVSLWAMAVGQREFSICLRLPVDYPELPPGLVLLSSSPAESVLVDFRGKGVGVLVDQYLKSPSSVRPKRVSTDIGEPFPVEIRQTLSSDDLVFDGPAFNTLSVDGFEPISIEMTIDRSTSMYVPVIVVSEGPVPAEYMWAVVNTDSVLVHGAESLLMRVRGVHTAPLSPAQPPALVPLTLEEGMRVAMPSEVEAALVPPVPLVGLGSLD